MFINGRWRVKTLCVRVVGLILIFGLLASVLGGRAIAQSDVSTKVILESRFILWDTNEKMIDPHFYINIFYYNWSDNSTAWYLVNVDGDVRVGAFQYETTLEYYLNNTEMISSISVMVNNKTVMTANTIFITEGITQAGIHRVTRPFTINLTPWEWNAMEWNIFYAIVTASLLSIIMAYRGVRYYRRKKGITEIT